MNNNIELPNPELTVIDPSIKQTDGKIGKEGKILLMIIAAVCVLICLCSMLCIGTGLFGIGSVLMERKPIGEVLNEFMIDVARNDVEGAYDLFSPRAQRQTDISDLARMSKGENAALFEGYQSLKVQNLNVSAAVNSDPNQPQGTVANVSGVIYYDRGSAGEFEAVLEKIDDKWMLFSIDLWLGTYTSPVEDVLF